MASRAALIPLAIIAPNVGPMRFEPSCSLSSIPMHVHISPHVGPFKLTSHEPREERRRRTGHDQPRRDLARAVDDRRLGAVHVQPAHVPQLLEEAHGDEPLGGERAHGAVVARRADDDGRGDDVRVHARLRVVVERDERPVRDDARDALAAWGRVEGVGADDEVLDGGGVHEDDVGEREHAGENGGCEERGVLHDDERPFVFERHPELGEEAVCGLAHDHGRHELAAEPCAAACSGRDADEGRGEMW